MRKRDLNREAAEHIKSLQAKLTEAEAREKGLREALEYVKGSGLLFGLTTKHDAIADVVRQALTKEKP